MPPSLSDKSPGYEDSRVFGVLDRYLLALQNGEEQLRAELLATHPELSDMLVCLESLERLAPPLPAQESDADDASTMPLSSPDAKHIGVHDSKAIDGVTFGKYALLGEVGRGGMGVVYQARQRDLNRTVALKMILSNQLASAEEIRRFNTEAKAAASLRHPNIVGIHEVGQVHGQHYFTMDFVQGPSLAEKLREGPLEPERAAKLLATVARAVEYLHRHNIVHRDLKPSNILMDEDGDPQITDFGLAKVFDADRTQTATGAILGTPSYMAPEQASGRHHGVTPHSDVYSLGAILYEMLTGRPPFREETPLDTLVQVLEGEPPLPRRLNRLIPDELELICLRCLERNPQDRYAAAAELADDLDRYLKGEPVAATSSGVLQRLKRWSRREPALASRLAGLTLAAGIVQSSYMLRGSNLRLHAMVMSIFFVWTAASFGFQFLANRNLAGLATRFAWSATDILMLTVLLMLAESPLRHLLIGYPLLIAASGMFFQVRLVAFTAILSLASYGMLQWFRHEDGPAHYPLIFAAALAVLGFIVGYQVYRVRVLTRYYQRRPIP